MTTVHPEITDQNDLEWRLIYSMIVAGKSAVFANNCIVKLSRVIPKPPLDAIAKMSEAYLQSILQDARTGNYNKLRIGFMQLAHAKIDLRTCKPEDLQRIHGIGPKTARFFISWTRPSERHGRFHRARKNIRGSRRYF